MTTDAARGTQPVPRVRPASPIGPSRRRLWPLVPGLVLLAVLFIIPMAFMLMYSFWRTDPNFNLVPAWTLDNYARFINIPTYLRTFIKTLIMASVVTATALATALPFAYFLVRYVSPRRQRAILLAVIVPFWTSYLLRVYAWQAILGEHGALNQALQAIGLIHEPSALFIYNDVGVFMVLTYLYFPFAALALYAALEKFDFAQFNAAQDLGARPDQAFRFILLPQIRAGIITACIFVFIPILGEFLTPALVGGAQGSLIANLVVTFFRLAQIAEGAALAIVIAVFVTVVLIIFRRYLRVEDVVARG
ncbi:MAG TPA: ABC transporter permease [Candidatus Limnocylindrales bacterium]|jgi:spermidine/putrescine transport system permease protein|nr:ABC transporter permease [Candidatus Limnocylindrales bacterium]